MQEADNGLADFIVSHLTKKGATYAEARLETYSGDGFLLKNGVMDAAGFETTTGMGVRYVINGTLGFFDINMMEKDSVIRTADASFTMTNSAFKIGDKVKMSEEKAVKKKYEVKEKRKLADVDADEKIGYVIGLDKALIESGADVTTRYLSYNDGMKEKYFVNSEGSEITARIPRVDLFYLFTVKEGNQTVQRTHSAAAAGGFEFTKSWKLEEEIPREAKALKRNMKEGVKAPAGMTDIVVAPEVTGIMAHESVGHPYEADRILGREGAQAGESFVTKDMIGTRIGSEIVTVVDDPTMENAFGHFLFDDEGVPSRRKFLMKEGMINEFLQNRETAAEFGIKSNGSSRASMYGVEAILRMSNTFVLPGKWKEDELIRDTKHGVYFKNFMEWNIDDLRLNQRYVASEAYLIENGELTRPVKNPVIEVNTPALWGSINAIADRIELHPGNCGKGEPMQGIPVTMGGPTLRFRAPMR